MAKEENTCTIVKITRNMLGYFNETYAYASIGLANSANLGQQRPGLPETRLP